MRGSILMLSAFFLFGCHQNNRNSLTKADTEVKQPVQKKRPVAIENGKFFESEGKKMLYGGERESDHFNITNYLLKDDQFHYGIGREALPGLIGTVVYFGRGSQQHLVGYSEILISLCRQ